MAETLTTANEDEQETVTAFLDRSAPLLAAPDLRARVDEAIKLGGSKGLAKLIKIGPIFERLTLLATSQEVPPATVLEEVKKRLPK